jgi:hypothetical protein
VQLQGDRMESNKTALKRGIARTQVLRKKKSKWKALIGEAANTDKRRRILIVGPKQFSQQWPELQRP